MASEQRLRAFLDANLTLLGSPFEVPPSKLHYRTLDAAIKALNDEVREAGHTLFSRSEQRRFTLSASTIPANEAPPSSASDLQASDLPSAWPSNATEETKEAYAALCTRVKLLEERAGEAKLQSQRYAALTAAIGSVNDLGEGLLRPGSALSDTLKESTQLVSQLRSRLTPAVLASLATSTAKRQAQNNTSELAALRSLTKRARQASAKDD